jgi:CheY-like chemotaxis protein
MRTVLVADDDEEQRKTMAEFLREVGYTVLVAEDGLTALRLIREQVPDLVVLDGFMPGLEGWQVLGQMSEDQALCRIPVVLTSGCSVSASRREDVVFVPKPISLPRLFHAVRALVENPRPTPVTTFPAVA